MTDTDRRLPLLLELDDVVPDVDLQGATSVHVTVLWRGRPLGVLDIDAPVGVLPAAFLARRVSAELSGEIGYARAQDVLAEAPVSSSPSSGTVVVCTRNRPAALRTCLVSLAALDERVPVDVVVVDNGDRDGEVEALVEGFGFRWVHESLPGLDRARNRGLLEATTEVVLFTDDDVEVHPLWAARLLECFVDERVGVATGLVLPAELDTRAQQDVERYAGFSRGLSRRVLSPVLHDPVNAGALGAGASLAVRRRTMLELGGFPEHLDGGMPTRSGGDTYGVYRLLHSGVRGVYEPRALAFHRHRSSHDDLISTVAGYSTGAYAFLLTALLQDRDPAALREAFGWGRRWLAPRLLGALRGRVDAPPLDVALAEVRGALAAPKGYLRALAVVRERGPLTWVSPESAQRPTGASARGHAVPLTVVIPTRGRRHSVVRLLLELDEQSRPASQIVVVVDGDVDGTARAIDAVDFATPVTVVVNARNAGAAAARNRGAGLATSELLLFLDDDVRPVPGLLAAHAAAHQAESGPVVVVGPCPPAPTHRTDPHAVAVLEWWADHARRMREAPRLSWTDLGTGNVTMPRSLFSSLGGFAELARREDWELGYRIQARGVPILHAPAAAVVHDSDVSLLSAFRDRVAEGAGDLEMTALHPGLAHVLPLARQPVLGWRGELLATAIFRRPSAVSRLLPVAAGSAAVLAQVGTRRRYQQLNARVAAGAYMSGVALAAGSRERYLAILSDAAHRDSAPETLELTKWPWGPPHPNSMFLQLLVEQSPLAVVPSAWGGFPWSAGLFRERVVGHLHPALTGRLAAAAVAR